MTTRTAFRKAGIFSAVALGIVLVICFRFNGPIQPAAPSSPQPVMKSNPTSNPATSGEAEAAKAAIAASAAGTAPPAQPTTRPQQDAVFRALPQTEQQSLWAAFHAARHAVESLTEQEASLPQNTGVRFFAANPRQRLTARFLDGAVRIESGCGRDWSATLRHGDSGVTPVAEGHRVEFRHPDGVTEWYVNQAEGLEHGFTLAHRPAQAEPGELRLTVALEGLTARAVAIEEVGDRPGLEFVNPANESAVLRYSNLRVSDAGGRELPAHFEANASGLDILVDDTGAVYPVTVDPLITSQEAKLWPESDAGGAWDRFGQAVAIVGDTALVGANGDSTPAGSFAGSAYVFVRSGTYWIQQAKLTAGDAEANDSFGISVALSGDTALIGADLDSTFMGYQSGSAYVFVRNGSLWRQQAKLLASDGGIQDFFGRAVALSGDTALIGSPKDDTEAASDAGSAYVFVRSGTNWNQQAKLMSPEGEYYDDFGVSVALEGDTALIGVPLDDNLFVNEGSAFVFVRDENIWALQTKLTAGGDSTVGANFGSAVALSGNTALVGAPHGKLPWHETPPGIAYVFGRAESMNWYPQSILMAPGSGDGRFGFSVALSGDTALVGDEGNTFGSGSAYVFVRRLSNDPVPHWSWSLDATLEPSDRAAGDAFGWAVALSGDTALVGAPNDDTWVPSVPGLPWLEMGTNAGSAYVFVRTGTAWAQLHHLTPQGGGASDHFGNAVAVSGDTALIGVYNDDRAVGPNAGCAYVFQRDGTTWTAQARLTADDGAAGDEFGWSVALAGNTALVGTPWKDKGSAYAFARNGTGWSQQAKLTAGENDPWAQAFGFSVALWGETALVGVTGGSGSAYVFMRSGGVWSEQTRLSASDAGLNDHFGCSVALERDTALVGAYHHGTLGGTNAGGAYVFARNGSRWTEQAKLLASDGAAGDEFGNAVALSGDSALIGAHLHDSAAGMDAGSAYFFVRDGTNWSQQTKLTAADGAAGDEFGFSVALAGDLALVGAPGTDRLDVPGWSDAGSAYLYAWAGPIWNQQAKLGAAFRYWGDHFGHAVALSGDTALVASPDDNTDAGEDSGSVFVFRLTAQGPEIEVTGNGVPIHSGDVTPSFTDQTDFGGADPFDFGSVVRDFTIQNLGNSNLNLADWPRVFVSGANVSDFTVTSPPADSVPPGGSTTFQVTFRPSDFGLRTATLTIASNDDDEDPHELAIQGRGMTPPEISCWPSSSTPSLGNFSLLSACADGSDLSFRWWKNGVPLTDSDFISGAQTDSLLVGPVRSSDAGNYYLVVTNFAGSVTSEVATLTVLLPTNYNRLGSQILPGGDVQLTFTGEPMSRYALDRAFNLQPPIQWMPQVTNDTWWYGWVNFTNTPVTGTNNYWRIRWVP